jgi:hypothetical protein
MHRWQTDESHTREVKIDETNFNLETLKYDADVLDTNSIAWTFGGENKWLVPRVAAIDGRCRS